MTAAESRPYTDPEIDPDQEAVFEPPLNDFEEALSQQIEWYGQGITSPDHFSLTPDDYVKLKDNVSQLGYDEDGYHQIIDMGDGLKRGLPVREEIGIQAELLVDPGTYVAGPSLRPAYEEARDGNFETDGVKELLDIMAEEYQEQGMTPSRADLMRSLQVRADEALQLSDYLEAQGFTHTEIDESDNDTAGTRTDESHTATDDEGENTTQSDEVDKAAWRTNNSDGNPVGGKRRGRRAGAPHVRPVPSVDGDDSSADNADTESPVPDADSQIDDDAAAAVKELDRQIAEDEAAAAAAEAEAASSASADAATPDDDTKTETLPATTTADDEDELAKRRAQHDAEAAAIAAEAAAGTADNVDNDDSTTAEADGTDDGLEMLEPIIQPKKSRVRSALGRLASAVGFGGTAAEATNDTDDTVDNDDSDDEKPAADNGTNADTGAGTNPDNDPDNAPGTDDDKKPRLNLQTRILLAGAAVEDWLTTKREVDGETIIETNKRRLALIAGGVVLAGVGIYAAKNGFSLGGGGRIGLDVAPQPGAGSVGQHGADIAQPGIDGSGAAAPGPDSLTIPDAAPQHVPDVVPQHVPLSGNHEVVMQPSVNGKADTVWSEAQRYYGTTNSRDTLEAIQKIQAANPDVDLNHVGVGKHIQMPEFTPGNGSASAADTAGQAASGGASRATAEQVNNSSVLPEYDAASARGTFSQSVLDYAKGHNVKLTTSELYKVLPSLSDYNTSVHTSLGDPVANFQNMRAGERVYLPPNFEQFVRHQLELIDEAAKNKN